MAKNRNRPGGTPPAPAVTQQQKIGFWKTDGPPLLVMLLATVIFYFPVLSLQGPIWNDFIEQYFPYRVFASRALRHFTFPFWNPYSFSGMPFFADIQSAVLYPLNILLLFFSGKNGISPVVYEYQIVAHILLAGIFTYVLARDFHRGRSASLLAALVLMFSGFTTTHIFHITMIHALPWFPCAFLLLRRAIHRSSIRYAFLTGIAVSFVAFAGHPQMFIYLHYLLGAWFIWYCIEQLRFKLPPKKLLMPAVLFLIAIGSGAGLSSVQLLPASRLGKESLRPEMEYKLSAQGSFRPYRFVTLLAPNFFGTPNNTRTQTPYYWGTAPEDVDPGAHYYWETSLYLGVLPLLFALIALLAVRSPPVVFLGIVAGGTFLIAMGDATPVYRLAYALVPGIKLFRNPARIGIIFTLVMALLSAFSVDWLIRMVADLPARMKKRVTVIAVAAGALIVAGALAFSSGAFLPVIFEFIAKNKMIGGDPAQLESFVSTGAYPFATTQIWIFTLFALISIGLLLGRIHAIIPVRLFSLLLPVILLIDTLLFGYGFAIIKTDPSKIYEKTPLIRSVRQEYKKKLFRINSRGSQPGSDDIGGPYMLFRRNGGTVHELFLMEGYNPLRLKRQLMDRKQSTLDILNIGYKIKVDDVNRTMSIVPHPSGLPRARMVSSYQVEPDETKILPLLQSSAFDHVNSVILEKQPESIPPGNPTEPLNSSAAISSYGINRIVTDVTTDKPALLVLSEVYYPSWKATVDGKPAPVLRADYALRAIPVPAGKHRVVCYYADPDFTKGLVISLLTFMGMVGTVAVVFLRKRKHSGAAAAAATK